LDVGDIVKLIEECEAIGLRLDRGITGLLVAIALAGCAFSQFVTNEESQPVMNEETAIAIATKLCASQIKGPVMTWARKDGDYWIVTSQLHDPTLAVPDWWEVSIPSSGPTTDARCVRRSRTRVRSQQ
jgi:hypothetical protein